MPRCNVSYFLWPMNKMIFNLIYNFLFNFLHIIAALCVINIRHSESHIRQ